MARKRKSERKPRKSKLTRRSRAIVAVRKRDKDRRISPNPTTYRERNALLKTLGFRTYKDYLESWLWQEIKRKAFALHGYACVFCKEKSILLHHKSYHRKVLLGEDLTPLAPMCRECHEMVELDSNGKKRRLKQAQAMFLAMMRSKRQ
jgi:hypothetical protein